MLPDTWLTRDLPVLEAIARISETRHPQLVDGSEIVEATGLTLLEVALAVEALEGPYLAGPVNWADCGGDALTPTTPGVTSSARRLLGMWPTPESLAERALAVVEERIETANDDEERSRWVKLRDGITSAGRDLLVDVMGAVVSRQITGP